MIRLDNISKQQGHQLLFIEAAAVLQKGEKAGLVGVSVRDAAQATLDSVLGNINTPSVWIDGANGQSYYVVTQVQPQSVGDPAALASVPVKVGQNGAAITLGSCSTTITVLPAFRSCWRMRSEKSTRESRSSSSGWITCPRLSKALRRFANF